ncbi:MAG: Mov34/MPN/PAD-1 family protein [Methanobacterium sp.]
MTIIRFKSFNHAFHVEIHENVLNDIKKECMKANAKETGGILIGSYSKEGDKATISNITGPPRDSKQHSCGFERGVNGLIKLLDSKWDSSSRKYYIGEWHFHPNSSPKPSTIDDKQMKQLSVDKLLKCPEPILLIVGGNQDEGWKLSLHLYKKDSKLALIKEN